MSRSFHTFIGAVLVAFATLFSATSHTAYAQSSHKTIVDVAVGAGSFDTLVAAVKAAGLAETLSGDGPVTVFAPTDEAFAKLPAGTVEMLLKPENKDQLVAILTYHVVAGRVLSSDLLSTRSAKTLNGASAPIGLSISDATIIQTDIKASNGIIHVIDKVLIPDEMVPSTAKAKGLIEDAIERGSSLYNMGQASASATVYEMVARSLLAYEGNMPIDARKTLQKALKAMSETHNADDRAWIMRRGLDGAYRSMHSRRMSSTVTTWNQ